MIKPLYPKNLNPHSAILNTIDAKITMVPVTVLPVRNIITPTTAPIINIKLSICLTIRN